MTLNTDKRTEGESNLIILITNKHPSNRTLRNNIFYKPKPSFFQSKVTLNYFINRSQILI